MSATASSTRPSASGGRRPQQQEGRLAIGGRAEAGQQAEHLARLDGVGDRLAEVHHHLRRPSWSPASSSRPTASSGRPRSTSSAASSPAVCGSTGAARKADAAARSSAPVTCRRNGTPAATARSTKPSPASLSRRCGRSPACGRAARSRRARGSRGAGAPPRWRRGPCVTRWRGIGCRVRGGTGRATVAMRRTLPSAASTMCRASDSIDSSVDLDGHLLGVEGNRIGIDDQPVDEVDGLVEESARMRPAMIRRGRRRRPRCARRRGRARPGTAGGHRRRRSRRPSASVASGELPRAAARRVRGAAGEPRLAVPRRRLQQHDRAVSGLVSRSSREVRGRRMGAARA